MAHDPGSAEGFLAERRDFERIMEAVRRVRAASRAELEDAEWVFAWVSSVGLSYLDPADETYADCLHLMNASFQGLSQHPREFAQWLHLLGSQRIRTYLEVGCYNGGTACLAAAYLQCFEPEFHLTTLDLWPWFLFEEEACTILPIEYRLGVTSRAFRGQRFDAVFIDGDHAFEWSWQDYQNAGRHARACAVHDIRSLHYQETLPLGGVTGMWATLKETTGGPGITFLEFAHHPAGDRFGIGVRLVEEG